MSYLAINTKEVWVGSIVKVLRRCRSKIGLIPILFVLARLECSELEVKPFQNLRCVARFPVDRLLWNHIVIVSPLPTESLEWVHKVFQPFVLLDAHIDAKTL